MSPPATPDLPVGVELLAEPIGWRCRTCDSSFTLTDPAAARLRPDAINEALVSSATQHLDHGCDP